MKKKIDTKFALALGLGILALVLGVGILFFKIEGTPWIAISIIILGLLATIFAVILYKRKGAKHELDYRTLFTMGIIFTAVGISTSNPGMWVLGLAFMAIGITNKKKWKKQRKWSELSKKEQKFKIILLTILGILLLAGFVFFFLSL